MIGWMAAPASIVWKAAPADVYFLPGSLDTIVELQGGGIDEIQTGVDVDLKTATLQNIENVTFISKIGRIGHGSDGANVMIGGTAGDVLIGAGGNDKLDGGYGNGQAEGRRRQ